MGGEGGREMEEILFCFGILHDYARIPLMVIPCSGKSCVAAAAAVVVAVVAVVALHLGEAEEHSRTKVRKNEQFIFHPRSPITSHTPLRKACAFCHPICACYYAFA